MAEIYTSYYGNPNLKRYTANGHDLVAISRSQPAGFKGMKYLKLAPSWALLKAYKDGRIDWPTYTQEYYDTVLKNLKASEVLADVGLEAILLCYEKPTDPCHRHLVADWIQNNAGIFVPEL